MAGRRGGGSADRISGSLDEGRTMFERRPEPPVQDPVCGMELRPLDAAGSSEYLGQRFYFCSEGCKRRFDASPEMYVAAPEPSHRAT